ncbi:MAG TPA: hypothetical protein DDZ55_04985 [Firmicutes bacterium]|nr:hypothetical protein [Bacillota bacterium]
MSDHEVKSFPKKRIYKRRSISQTQPPTEPPSSTPSKGLPPEDLAALLELAPKLSPKGQEVIGLLLKVFNEKGELNTDQLLQLISNYNGQAINAPPKNNPNPNPNLSSVISMLPLLTSSLGNQGINPTVLASLVSMLAANRPRE